MDHSCGVGRVTVQPVDDARFCRVQCAPCLTRALKGDKECLGLLDRTQGQLGIFELDLNAEFADERTMSCAGAPRDGDLADPLADVERASPGALPR